MDYYKRKIQKKIYRELHPAISKWLVVCFAMCFIVIVIGITYQFNNPWFYFMNFRLVNKTVSFVIQLYNKAISIGLELHKKLLTVNNRTIANGYVRLSESVSLISIIKNSLLALPQQLANEDSVPFYNVAVAFFSVSAAYIVLFYSVMDNRREGIPYRKIMSYAFGSFSVPMCFAFSMLFLLAGYVMYVFQLEYMYVAFLVCVIFCQLFCVFMIMLVSSLRFDILIIKRTEQKRIKFMYDNWDRLVDNKMIEIIGYYNQMEMAVNSIEHTSDKYDVIKEILVAPFEMSHGVLDNDKLLFYYYYNNVFDSINNRSDKDDVRDLYSFLCDFIRYLPSYMKNSQGIYPNQWLKTYFSIISSIWLAAFQNDDSKKHAEKFCVRTLDIIYSTSKSIKLFTDKNPNYVNFANMESHGASLGVYIFLQEFINCYDATSLQLTSLFNSISTLRRYQCDNEAILKLSYELWQNWSFAMGTEVIGDKMNAMNAVDTALGRSFNALIVWHCISQMKKRFFINENTSFTIN